MQLFTWPCALLLAVAVSGCGLSADDPAGPVEAEVTAPTAGCAPGFADVIANLDSSTTTGEETAPARIGLRPLRSLVACAVRLDAAQQPGAEWAYVVLRPDVTERALTIALRQAGLRPDGPDVVGAASQWASHRPPPGRVESLGIGTYEDRWSQMSAPGPARAFRSAYPSGTLTLFVSLARAPAFDPGSLGDVGTTGQAGSWTCSYRPTMDRDWHNDALCTDGSELVRPYLREWDGYITPDELMASAQEWADRRNRG